ncbi:MAG TPA: hypothetical protein VNW15_07325 [Rhizomicrobium sp.]|jgi:hypothetical protein|nr:hypothetical protein [Rhizomicrobium sp.]
MRFMRFLHGSMDATGPSQSPVAGTRHLEKGEDFKCVYAEYACAVSHANVMLQRHGMASAQFSEADIASMRLFHRVKKMQGLGKPKMA